MVVLTLSLVAATSSALAVSPDTNFLDPQIVSGNPQLKQLMDQVALDGQPGSLLDEHFLFASLIWGSVGGGYLLYARKQRMIVPFVGGVAMIGASFLVISWLWMSLFCIGVVVAVYKFIEWG